MRLDHLLSKESSGNERVIGNVLGQYGALVTLFNLEGVHGPIAQLARAHD